jgi:hypothetical protein
VRARSRRDPAAHAVAEVERMVRACAGVDAVLGPAAQFVQGVSGACEVAGVKL